jgi:hypothetical protein
MPVTNDQIRDRIRAAPFRPFTLHLADGRAISVPHSEFAAMMSHGRTVLVVDPVNQERLEYVDVGLVLSISTQEPGTESNRN